MVAEMNEIMERVEDTRDTELMVGDSEVVVVMDGGDERLFLYNVQEQEEDMGAGVGRGKGSSVIFVASQKCGQKWEELE